MKTEAIRSAAPLMKGRQRDGDRLFGRAARMLDFVSIALPQRVSEEEVGDALEGIHELVAQGGSAARIYTRVVSVSFWLLVNSFRDRLAKTTRHVLPGATLRLFAEYLFSRLAYSRYLEPIISDLQQEYREAMSEGRLLRACRVLLRGYWAFWLAALRKLPSSKIRRPPGSKLLSVAEFLFSPKTYSTVLEPVIRDLQDEHFEALAHHRLWKARYVSLRGYCAFWSAVWAQCSHSLGRKFLKALGSIT